MNKNDFLSLFKTLVEKHNLPIKPIAYKLVGDTPTFYFTAPQPVDFRALVTELNQKLNVKSHLQQVGPRTCTKLQGGVGPCGRPLCCKQWLPSFPQISAQVIQKQGLETEISQHLGLCGKPFCCLAYENEDFKLKKHQEIPKKKEVKQEAASISPIPPIPTETKQENEAPPKTEAVPQEKTEISKKQKVVRRILRIKKLKKK